MMNLLILEIRQSWLNVGLGIWLILMNPKASKEIILLECLCLKSMRMNMSYLTLYMGNLEKD